MPDYRPIDAAVLLALALAAFAAGCVADRRGFLPPDMDAAVVKILKVEKRAR